MSGREDYNKVILIGENHHNGLGLVRSFGINGIKPYGIIIGENAKKGFLRKSKYWKKTWVVKDENEALQLIIDMFSQEKLKPVIIPYSDKFEDVLDRNLNKVLKGFIVPSINEKQGEIAELMNKQQQCLFCKENGIEMLPSKILDISKNDDEDMTSNIEWPAILKPVVSAEGKKLDIRICYDASQFDYEISKLLEKGYHRILVQKYLQDKTEYVLTGAVGENIKLFSIVSHIRTWPINRGDGSFSKIEDNKDVFDYADRVLDIIRKIKYSGTIDIEFFKDGNGKFYLNEINWRSSGRNFVSLYTNVYSAYYYYCSITGREFRVNKIKNTEGFSMNEAVDLRHIVYGDLSPIEWLKDCRKTKNFALWYPKDLKPTFSQYIHLVKEMVRRNRSSEWHRGEKV